MPTRVPSGEWLVAGESATSTKTKHRLRWWSRREGRHGGADGIALALTRFEIAWERHKGQAAGALDCLSSAVHAFERTKLFQIGMRATASCQCRGLYHTSTSVPPELYSADPAELCVVLWRSSASILRIILAWHVTGNA